MTGVYTMDIEELLEEFREQSGIDDAWEFVPLEELDPEDE